jgi:EAL domain-containing protein (putative c-di-GMP-specific phosphodiesterase class I)
MKPTSARYHYNLVTRRNRWIDHGHESIFGYSQDEIYAMGDGVLDRIIHPDDMPIVRAYHKRLRHLQTGETAQVFCRCYGKCGDSPLFVRFLDGCVAHDARGCTAIEGEATVLSVQEFDARKRLEAGIKHREFGFHYQPICRLSDGVVVGYEALARWFRPDGIVGPQHFLHLLEGSSLEQPWIASQVEQVIAALDKLDDSLWLSYNLSRTAVESGNAWPVIPATRSQRLHIEILESISTEVPDALNQLRFIHSCGHPLFIDDYGAGLSLPTLLSGLPVSGVKLDKVLVDGIPHDQRLCNIVDGILDLAAQEGLETIAEWVQRPDQVDWLLSHGCDYGQGSLFGLAGEL